MLHTGPCPLAEEKSLSEQGEGLQYCHGNEDRAGQSHSQGRSRTKPPMGRHSARAAALTQAELDWLSWLSMTMEVQP